MSRYTRVAVTGTGEDGPSRSPSPMRLVGLGMEFAVTVVLGLAAGYYLDRWLGTKPWLLMVGVVLGGVLGLYGFLRRLTPIGRG